MPKVNCSGSDDNGNGDPAFGCAVPDSIVLQQRAHPLDLDDRLTDSVKAALHLRFGSAWDRSDLPLLFAGVYIPTEQPMIAVEFAASKLLARVRQHDAPCISSVLVLTRDEARRLRDELGYTLSLGERDDVDLGRLA